jgi:hypothetical protein
VTATAVHATLAVVPGVDVFDTGGIAVETPDVEVAGRALASAAASEGLDAVVVLQATFTDSTLPAAAVAAAARRPPDRAVGRARAAHRWAAHDERVVRDQPGRVPAACRRT